MEIPEAFSLMHKIREAEANDKTPVGAAKSLSKHLGKGCGAYIGPCLSDGRFALYAASDSKKADIPEEWCGFPVVNMDKEPLK